MHTKSEHNLIGFRPQQTLARPGREHLVQTPMGTTISPETMRIILELFGLTLQDKALMVSKGSQSISRQKTKRKNLLGRVARGYRKLDDAVERGLSVKKITELHFPTGIRFDDRHGVTDITDVASQALEALHERSAGEQGSAIDKVLIAFVKTWENPPISKQYPIVSGLDMRGQQTFKDDALSYYVRPQSPTFYGTKRDGIPGARIQCLQPIPLSADLKRLFQERGKATIITRAEEAAALRLVDPPFIFPREITPAINTAFKELMDSYLNMLLVALQPIDFKDISHYFELNLVNKRMTMSQLIDLFQSGNFNRRAFVSKDLQLSVPHVKAVTSRDATTLPRILNLAEGLLRKRADQHFQVLYQDLLVFTDLVYNKLIQEMNDTRQTFDPADVLNTLLATMALTLGMTAVSYDKLILQNIRNFRG